MGVHSKFYTKNTDESADAVSGTYIMSRKRTEKRADHRIMSKFSAKIASDARTVQENERTVQPPLRTVLTSVKFLVQNTIGMGDQEHRYGIGLVSPVYVCELL